MNRRDFVTAMLGASTAALVLPRIELVAKAFGPASDGLGSESWQQTFDVVLKEAWRLFVKHHGPAVTSNGPPQRIGDQRDGYTFTNQLSLHGHSEYFKRTGGLDHAMESFAKRCKHERLQAFAPLKLPVAVTYAKNAHDTLRMVAAYTIETDDLITRFDVLGGRAI